MKTCSPDLSLYDNTWYRPGPMPKRLIWYFVNMIFFNSPYLFPSALKCFLLRMFGAKVGKNVIIKPFVNIKYPWFLEIGDHVWIGEQVWIDCLCKVTIQNHVCISQGALILTGNHNYKSRAFDLQLGEVTLSEGCWIAARAVVCPGVTCNKNSVLAVGSVASSDLEESAVYKGNPAVKVRQR